MLKYEGSNNYTFWNHKNQKISLAIEDINSIIELASKDENFEIGERLLSMGRDKEFWKDSYEQLVKDIKKLVD